MFDATKPVRTRDGRKARIICTDRKATLFHIVALIVERNNEEQVATYPDHGRYRLLGNSPHDLINITEDAGDDY